MYGKFKIGRIKMNEQNLTRNQTTMTLAERLKAKTAFLGSDTVILCDTSSSMNTEIEPGKSRITALQDILKSLHGKLNLIEFNNYAMKVNEISIPYGMTYYSEAFKLAKSLGFKNALMLTDGECSGNDKNDAIAESKELNLQIMYIGSGERPSFLDELGATSVTVQDLRKGKEIAGKIQLLLGSPEETKKGPICL
jgi:hypothetical protein